jgi:hypothetical protein
MACVVIGWQTETKAQGWVDQVGIMPIAESQVGDIDHVKPVKWRVYKYADNIKDDKKGAWTELLAYMDTMQGGFEGKRRLLTELNNRVTSENYKIGRDLLLPDRFEEDFRAYSPYPFHYQAADTFAKLLIIDKFTQTFAAYEKGKLVRWGLISTGQFDDLTPPGRYNFNWKAEYRQSTAAPEGEIWELYWMFNFQAGRGIHVHQYALPISAPASHGCVRIAESDAKWNFEWANGWVQQGGKVKRNGTPLVVLHSNPPGRPSHWEINGNEVRSLVSLPDDLMEIEASTGAQREAAWASGW